MQRPRPSVSYSSATAIVATLLIGLLSLPVAAIDEKPFSFDTTTDLYNVCSTNNSDPNYVAAQTACTAFIEATVQYHDAVSDRKHLKRLICYPKGTSIADGKTAFLAWAKRNQGNATRMNELPVVGLVRALAHAYPCK